MSSGRNEATCETTPRHIWMAWWPRAFESLVLGEAWRLGGGVEATTTVLRVA